MHNRIKLHAFFFGKNNERKGKSMIVQLIENIYQFLWGEWIHVPLPGGGSLGLSLLIILLLPAGIVFTIKTRFLPIRLFPDMGKALTANNKNGKDEKSSLSSLQTLIVSTATRVGQELSQQYPQVEQGLYSGCGSQHCLDHRQPLSKQLLHSYIKKKTPCMVDIEEDQPIIFTTLWKRDKERRKNTR